MRRRVIFGGLAVVLGLAATAVYLRVQSGVHVWREEMRVVLQTPDGLATASAVREVRFVLNVPDRPAGAPAGMRVRGEAVSFDLGAAGALFVLIGQDEANLFRALRGDGVAPDAIRWQLWRPGLERELAEDDFPVLAYFPDPANPASARPLTRLSLPNILPGYALARITLTRRYGAVTQGEIDALMPWITDRGLLSGDRWRALKKENGSITQILQGLKPDLRAAVDTRPIGEVIA